MVQVFKNKYSLLFLTSCILFGANTQAAISESITMHAQVPVVCRMNLTDASAVGSEVTITFNTLCNTNHSARVHIEGGSTLSSSSFYYNNVPVSLSGQNLTLYNGNVAKIGNSTLRIENYNSSTPISITPILDVGA